MGKVERKGESEQIFTEVAEGGVWRVERARIKIGGGTYQEFAIRSFIINNWRNRFRESNAYFKHLH